MAVTVIGNVPAWLVVPERTPVEVFNENPVGSVPTSDHVIVPTPPLCVNCWLNAVPAVPVVTPGLVTLIVGQLIVSE